MLLCVSVWLTLKIHRLTTHKSGFPAPSCLLTSDCCHGDAPPPLPSPRRHVTYPSPGVWLESGEVHWFGCTVGLFVLRAVRNSAHPLPTGGTLTSPQGLALRLHRAAVDTRRNQFLWRGRLAKGNELSKSELIISCMWRLLSFLCCPWGAWPVWATVWKAIMWLISCSQPSSYRAHRHDIHALYVSHQVIST